MARPWRCPSFLHLGMANTYAKAVCDLKAGSPVANIMAGAFMSSDTDALTHYGIGGSSKELRRNLFFYNDRTRYARNSGKWCVGRDMSASNINATTTEAGIFQSSYNSVSGLQGLYASYKANKKSCFLISTPKV